MCYCSGLHGLDHLGLFDDHLCLFDRGDVDKTALVGGRAFAACCRFFHGLQDFAGFLHGLCGGGENLVGKGDLLGVDGPFADHSKGGGAQRLCPEAVIIREVAEGAIDGQKAVRAAGGDDGGLGPVPRVGPVFLALADHIVVFLRTADAGGGHAHGGREVGGAEAEGLHAGAGGGDGFDVGDAGGGFDDRLKADPLGAALGGFDRGDERVDGIDVFGAAGFGNHDLIKAAARFFKQINHITVPEGGIQPVDPNAEVFVAPIHIIDRLNGVFAGDILVGGRNGVFEVDVDDIGGAGGHFLEQLGVRARAKELATVGACGGGGLEAEAHL